MFRSVNPYNQQTINEFPVDPEKVIGAKIENAFKQFRDWRARSLSERAGCVARVGEILKKEKEKYALVITAEMGKTIKEARAEIEKCANACDFFSNEAERMLRDQLIATEARKSLITFQPLGPVLAIMPWNFPFWQVFRFAAPALMAGNVGLLKHASNVSGCSKAIESVFLEAGCPEGVFQSLFVESKDVNRIIEHNHVAAVTLTGSEYAGTQVASAAGKSLKKTVLELGGSDPFIVLEDADLDEAARVASQSRMQNAGQSCIAAKRFIVVKSVKDRFIEKFMRVVGEIRQGNPMDEQTTMGPIARLDLAEEVEKQMRRSLEGGARKIVGGERVGCNFSPAILESVVPGNVAFEEEVFGPVAPIIEARDEQDAIALANQNRYGLGGSVWSRDIDRAGRVALALENGCVFVNSLMRSDQRLPFGGIKKSGYGRELSELGIKEFVNAKTIYIA
jgi:succinate-semialdehyde dehydrogenase / glutarate-semialdehyde dehydrogenase